MDKTVTMDDPEACALSDLRIGQARLRVQALALSGGRCAFPGCQWQTTAADPRLLEVAHIQSLMREGPRYEPRATLSPDNALVPCANHHRLVDGEPATYDVEWLRQQRAAQVAAAARAFKSSAVDDDTAGEGLSLSQLELLQYWERNCAEASEEHWQRFFVANPVCLAATLQGRAYTLLGKCYVGGKSVENRGGNEVDVLASHVTNASLVEIKTPAANLIGPSYRGNTHLMGKDVHGGVLQVLESRRSLLESIAHLNYNSAPERRIAAPAPYCVLVVGNTQNAGVDACERVFLRTLPPKSTRRHHRDLR